VRLAISQVVSDDTLSNPFFFLLLEQGLSDGSQSVSAATHGISLQVGQYDKHLRQRRIDRPIHRYGCILGSSDPRIRHWLVNIKGIEALRTEEIPGCAIENLHSLEAL
jgi:hypothetical protein